MNLLFSLIIGTAGAFLYRARGRRVTSKYAAFLKRAIIAALAAPFAYAAVLWTGNLWIMAAIWAATFAAFLMGHASHIDLGHMPDGAPVDGQKDEWYAHWLRRINLSAFWRDFCALGINGLMIVLPTILVALVAARWGSALWLLVPVAGKPCAYWLGWKALSNWRVKDPLKVAEPAFGFVLLAALGMAL